MVDMTEISYTLPPDDNLERERLTSLIGSMADGVIAIDENKMVAIYNGAALNILDINSTISGKIIDQVLRLLDKNNMPINVLELISQIKTAYSTRDLSIKYKDGSSINLYLSIAPVHLGYGKNGAKGHVLLLRDITREKSLEEERDEFISVISHELRTPIAIAEGNISNAQMIADKNGNIVQVKEALKEAYDQTIFLSGMINDLATLARAERGKLAVEIEDINAHELISDLSENYTPQAKNKNLDLFTEIDASLEMLKSSKLYVREILQNFITNALKYTDKGSITISARPHDDGVLFKITDTGIGISKTDQEKVFDKFFRSEDYRTRKYTGTGLGLYVTMKLANLINAKINLHSELNKGSTFEIYIPNLKKPE